MKNYSASCVVVHMWAFDSSQYFNGYLYSLFYLQFSIMFEAVQFNAKKSCLSFLHQFVIIKFVMKNSTYSCFPSFSSTNLNFTTYLIL